tara:strand:- start:1349 stop:1627 length:279 start_codon:yes stop_codon:yes gene_type:complete
MNPYQELEQSLIFNDFLDSILRPTPSHSDTCKSQVGDILNLDCVEDSDKLTRVIKAMENPLNHTLLLRIVLNTSGGTSEMIRLFASMVSPND